MTSEGASRGDKRGSQDQSSGGFVEPEATTDFPYMEETGAMRHLHLEDRAPLSLDPALQQYSPLPATPSESKLGMKRRASSPPPDSSHDDKAPLHSAGSGSDLYQRNSNSNSNNPAAARPTNRASPVNRFAAQHGSVSSTSSAGLRNGSYASSGALSVGSSLTSLSSNHDRLSPTSEYPHPQSHPERDSPYITSHPSPRSSLPHSHPRPPSEKPSPRKMSSDTPATRNQNNTPNIQAPMYICQCCPKKPKKFETEEELRYVFAALSGHPQSAKVFPLGHTSPRSNTSVISATTGSRTRTKRSVIRTRYMSADIRGRARLCKATTNAPSTLPLTLHHKIPTNLLHHPTLLLPQTSAGTAGKSSRMSHSRTGTTVLPT